MYTQSELVKVTFTLNGKRLICDICYIHNYDYFTLRYPVAWAPFIRCYSCFAKWVTQRLEIGMWMET